MARQISLTPKQRERLAALLKDKRPPDGWRQRPYYFHLAKVLYGLQHMDSPFLDEMDAAALERLYPGVIAITGGNRNADLTLGDSYGREGVRV